MSFNKFIFGFLVLICVDYSFAKDCEKDSENMAQVRACLAEEQDGQLKSEYEKTYKIVANQDLTAAQLLEKAQQTWIKFATESCNYSVRARQTELMANDFRTNCWAGFVNARIKILKSYRVSFGRAE